VAERLRVSAETCAVLFPMQRAIVVRTWAGLEECTGDRIEPDRPE
jgi:hypothetical protein